MVYPNHPYGLRSSGEVETVSQLDARRSRGFPSRPLRRGARSGCDHGRRHARRSGGHRRALTSGLPRERDAVIAARAGARARDAVQWSRIPRRRATSSSARRGCAATIPIISRYSSAITCSAAADSSRASPRKCGRNAASRIPPTAISRRCCGRAFRRRHADAGEQAQTRSRSCARRWPISWRRARPQELAAAKKNLIGGFPLRIDSNRKIHEYLALIGFYRLPLTYLDDFVKNVERVTAAEVAALPAQGAIPRQVTVVVGRLQSNSAAADRTSTTAYYSHY